MMRGGEKPANQPTVSGRIVKLLSGMPISLFWPRGGEGSGRGQAIRVWSDITHACQAACSVARLEFAGGITDWDSTRFRPAVFAA